MEASSRRGVVLVVTLVILVIITMIATTLMHTAHTEMLIAHNARRHLLAKQSSMSGIHHFESLGLHYADLEQRLMEEDETVIIPRTPLGNTFYEVIVKSAPGENRFIVISRGLLLDGERISAQAATSATYETIIPGAGN
jgi:hypothetical protein